MAVEARHLHLFSPQFLVNRELGKGPAMVGDPQVGLSMPIAGTGQLVPPFHSLDVSATVPSESSLTFAVSAGKKRQREPISCVGEELSAHLQNQMVDLDRLLAHHTMRTELADRYRRQLAAAIEYGVRKRVKAKEDEIERAKKLNRALEDRIRTLFVENQIWRELAQTNLATANLLRTNLEQVLAAQACFKDEEKHECDGGAAADDAESCCFGERDDLEVLALDVSPARTCRSCRQRESTVLLLPCRHLCVCAACGPVVDSCPVCNCNKSGSVNVNLS